MSNITVLTLLGIVLIAQIILIRLEIKRVWQVKKLKRQIERMFDLPLGTLDLWSTETIKGIIRAKISADILQKLMDSAKQQGFKGFDK